MARPENVRLTITARSGSPTSTVTVTYDAVFNQGEVTANRLHQETIQLFGEDPPPGPAGDVSLFTYPPRSFRPNGQRRVPRRRNAEVLNRVLDEDRGLDEDEIYARVCLQVQGVPNAPQRCNDTGIISQLVAEPSDS